MNSSPLHVERDGPGGVDPLVLLHPLPHSGAFFNTITGQLSRVREVIRPDYPGFGRSPAPAAPPSVEAYSEAVAAAIDPGRSCNLLGFHTGCLVAAELALRYPDRVSRLILIDIPCFDRKDAAGMFASVEASGKYDEAALAGFRGAFAYPASDRLKQLRKETLVIATASSLYEATLSAAALITGSRLETLTEVRAPVFENGVDAIGQLCHQFLSS